MRRTLELLAQVRLTDNERREAEHYLLLGERVAGAILDATAALLSTLRSLERAVRPTPGTGRQADNQGGSRKASSFRPSS